ACYQRALARNPSYAKAHNNLGNARAAQGRVDEAIACYHRAIASEPTDANAHYNLGVALAGRKQGKQAIACYRRAIALDPGHARGRWTRPSPATTGPSHSIPGTPAPITTSATPSQSRER